MKNCSRCKKIKPLEDFYKDRKSKDGFSYYCRECVKNSVKMHRQDPEYRKKQMEWNEKWAKNNREKRLAIRNKSQRKIYRLLKVVGFVTAEIRKRIYDRDHHQCLGCGSTEKLTIDHIVPLSKGGWTKDDNLQTLCVSCNSKKGDKSFDYRS